LAALSHRKPASAGICRDSSGAQLNFLWLCRYFPRRINQLIFVMEILCSVWGWNWIIVIYHAVITSELCTSVPLFNPSRLNIKQNLKIQSAPRSKQFPSLLQKPVS
jgi:hypothetical protein